MRAEHVRAMRNALERMEGLDKVHPDIRRFFVHPDCTIVLLARIALDGGRAICPRLVHDGACPCGGDRTQCTRADPAWTDVGGWMQWTGARLLDGDVMEMNPRLLAAFLEEAGVFERGRK